MDDIQAQSDIDAPLIHAAVAGDESAFAELFQRYYPRVYRTIYGILGDATDAQEVTQSVWIKAWQKRTHYNFKSAYTTWLHRIAVNTALDELRRRRRYWTRFKDLLSNDQPTKESPNTPTAESDPAQNLLKIEDYESLHLAIAKLPEAQRTVLVLKEFENYTYEQIAATLGCKIGTVMSRLHHARTKLNTLLTHRSP
jgi:RNA polymerase sigma-70 factor (ECF subfamily)